MPEAPPPRCALCPAPAVTTARAGGAGEIPVCAAHGPHAPAPRRHKYGAKVETVDGVRFASRREARRYRQLKALADAGAVANLRLQVRYPIAVNGVTICTYVADFVYNEGGPAGPEVVEDCKGYRTPEYRLKKKLMRAVYGVEIRET